MPPLLLTSDLGTDFYIFEKESDSSINPLVDSFSLYCFFRIQFAFRKLPYDTVGFGSPSCFGGALNRNRTQALILAHGCSETR